MYILRIDGYPHTYEPGDRARTPFTLVAAMRAAYGCGNAHIERADGTRVVTDAGRAYSDLVHAPSGRRFRRISGHRGTLGARPSQGHPFTVVYSNWTPR